MLPPIGIPSFNLWEQGFRPLEASLPMIKWRPKHHPLPSEVSSVALQTVIGSLSTDSGRARLQNHAVGFFQYLIYKKSRRRAHISTKLCNFAPVNEKKPLLGMTPDELREVALSLGMPAFTGKQMAQWLYQRHVRSIDEMTNLSKANRERLALEYCVGAMEPIDCQRSVDGTIKYLFPARCFPVGRDSVATNSTRFVETVFIPDGERATLCVSSQVGCKMNCLFCQTGKQGFEGNLTAGDILNQIYALPEADRLTNIVFMGQGEPMDNLDAVLRATEILTAPWGWGWSPKRITVSSVGIPRKLERFLKESECHLAISLHSPLHEQRAQLMPAEKAMPAKEVIALLAAQDFTHQRRISFEYIMFGGLNDSRQHAQAVVDLLQPLDKAIGGKWDSQLRVNLIRFHQIPDVDLPAADEHRMEQFRDYLCQHGITTTIRASRGQDIYAACGLLTTDKKKALAEGRKAGNVKS